MKKLLIVFLVLLINPSNAIFGQGKNRLSIQTGLFHYFFDKTPLLNINYHYKSIKPFKGLFYNSVDIQYRRMIDSVNSISLEGSYYIEPYHNVIPNKLINVLYMRSYGTINTTYERTKSLAKNVNLTYGGGLNFRIGTESAIVNYSNLGGYIDAELNLESREMFDVGLNIRSGIEYSPLKWLTLYTKFDLIGFVYQNDHKQIKRIKNAYNYKNYPTPFDLSWQFGIGFNFGK